MTAQTRLLRNQKGFTLIELLVVIGILAVLLAITLIAINPARQFAQANNTKRQSDVNAILNATHQYAADWNGLLPGDSETPDEITTTVQNISNTAADICSYVVPTYIAALPTDPQTGAPTPGGNIDQAGCSAAHDTGYTVVRTGGTSNRVTVAAPAAELTESISVTR